VLLALIVGKQTRKRESVIIITNSFEILEPRPSASLVMGRIVSEADLRQLSLADWVPLDVEATTNVLMGRERGRGQGQCLCQ
jgi:hypothetical protein